MCGIINRGIWSRVSGVYNRPESGTDQSVVYSRRPRGFFLASRVGKVQTDQATLAVLSMTVETLLFLSVTLIITLYVPFEAYSWAPLTFHCIFAEL